MNAHVTNQPQSQPRRAQTGSLPLGSAGPGDAIPTPPTLPVKRNAAGEVEFVSSHPVKQLRLGTEEDETRQPPSQAQPRATLHNPASLAANQASTQAPRASAGRSSQMSLDQRVNAKPFGLAAHLASHSTWHNRGTSFPSVENFSFQTAYPSSHRPADSAAVSPKQIPRNLSVHQEQSQIRGGTQATPNPGVSINQAPWLDTRTRHQSVSQHQPHYAASTVNGSNVYDTANCPSNTPLNTAKRGPCRCNAARQVASRGQTYGQHHGHLPIRGQPSHPIQQLQRSVGNPFPQQSHQFDARPPPPMAPDGSIPYLNPSYLLQPGPNWLVPDPVPSYTTPTTALPPRPSTGGDAIVPLRPPSYHLGATGFPNNAGNHSSKASRPPLPPSADDFALTPSPRNQQLLSQQLLSLPHPEPLSIPAAISRAASHVHTRPFNEHAQDLLVDVAETVAEIFPCELIAHRHGCSTSKVAEALAAVVQVPLLRCASDRRRHGKLATERLKQFRETRKVWDVGERDRERLRRERIRRGGAGNRVGGGGGHGETDRDEEKVGNEVKSEESRSVFVPPAPGQPSVLAMAQMMGPMDLPDVLTGDGVFTGQWWQA